MTGYNETMALCTPKKLLVGARAKSKNERETLLYLLICAQRVFSKLRKQKKDIDVKEFLQRIEKEWLK